MGSIQFAHEKLLDSLSLLNSALSARCRQLWAILCSSSLREPVCPQELVADLDHSSFSPQGHFLLRALCKRLQALPRGWDETTCLQRQQELLGCQWYGSVPTPGCTLPLLAWLLPWGFGVGTILDEGNGLPALHETGKFNHYSELGAKPCTSGCGPQNRCGQIDRISSSDSGRSGWRLGRLEPCLSAVVSSPGVQRRAETRPASQRLCPKVLGIARTVSLLPPSRVLVNLPPSLLVGSPRVDLPIPNCAEFFRLVNSELVSMEPSYHESPRVLGHDLWSLGPSEQRTGTSLCRVLPQAPLEEHLTPSL